MQKLKDQKGFTAFDIVIIIVALVAIGAAGYFAYQARSTTNSDYSVVVPKTKTTKATTTTPTPSPSPSQQQWLTVTELGIKIPLTTQLAGATYAYNTSNSTASLSTNAMTSADQGCSAGGGAAPGGTIGESVALTATGNTHASPDNTLSFKVNGKFVYINNPQATCSENAAVQTQAQQLWPEFRQAFLQAQPL